MPCIRATYGGSREGDSIRVVCAVYTLYTPTRIESPSAGVYLVYADLLYGHALRPLHACRYPSTRLHLAIRATGDFHTRFYMHILYGHSLRVLARRARTRKRGPASQL